MFVRVVCVLAAAAVVVDAQSNANLRRRPSRLRQPDKIEDNADGSEIKLAFVIFRHGDRTPDPEELDSFPAAHVNSSVFYPYGLRALTNLGKRHAYNVGEYLRKRYNGFLSEFYLPEEISIRTTDYARTKMTVLTALAGLYPPNRLQKWNYFLNWQPIPYDTVNFKEDDLQVYRSCPKYSTMKNEVYEIPEMKIRIDEYRQFMEDLSEHAGRQMKTPSDVYFFNNMVQCLENVGLQLPQWVKEDRSKLTEITNIELECEFYTPELKRLGGGVVLSDFLEASRAIISGDSTQPKVHLLSAHENSVAGVMTAVGVFTKPHQPNYGATFSLELRRNTTTSKYGVMAVYAPHPGGPGVPIPIPNCGEEALCDFDTFVDLTKDIAISRNEFLTHCV